MKCRTSHWFLCEEWYWNFDGNCVQTLDSVQHCYDGPFLTQLCLYLPSYRSGSCSLWTDLTLWIFLHLSFTELEQRWFLLSFCSAQPETLCALLNHEQQPLTLILNWLRCKLDIFSLLGRTVPVKWRELIYPVVSTDEFLFSLSPGRALWILKEMTRSPPFDMEKGAQTLTMSISELTSSCSLCFVLLIPAFIWSSTNVSGSFVADIFLLT